MELTISMQLENGKAYGYGREVVTKNWSISVPEGPGDHESEIRLVEAVNALVHFGDSIGVLCTELSLKEEEARAKELEENLKKNGIQFDKIPQPPAEPMVPGDDALDSGDGSMGPVNTPPANPFHDGDDGDGDDLESGDLQA